MHFKKLRAIITKLSVRHAPLAQLDRASGYGPEGRGFESLTAYQKSSEIERFQNSFVLYSSAGQGKNSADCLIAQMDKSAVATDFGHVRLFVYVPMSLFEIQLEKTGPCERIASPFIPGSPEQAYRKYQYFRRKFLNFCGKQLRKLLYYLRIKIGNMLKIKRKSGFFNENYAKFSKKLQDLLLECRKKRWKIVQKEESVSAIRRFPCITRKLRLYCSKIPRRKQILFF